mgnify:CR=1 FL=1
MTWDEIRDALTFELNPATTIADRCRGEQVKKELAKLIVVALKRSVGGQTTFYYAKVKEVGKRSCLRIREYREVETRGKTTGNVH